MGKTGKILAIITVVGIVIAIIVSMIPTGEQMSTDEYVSDCSSDSYSSYNSYESHDSARHRSVIKFQTAYDVTAYLSGRKFYCSSKDITMQIKSEGIYLNGNCCTGAVNVIEFSGTQALISAWSPYNGAEFSFIVDTENGSVSDNSDVYFER